MRRSTAICFLGYLFVAFGVLTDVCAVGVQETPQTSGELHAGFAEVDITPAVGDKPVYLAGFRRNHKATKVHDSLKARAVVLRHADRKVAVVSLDLVGLFHETTERVR